MRIVFITGGLEPDRDGVGDYTRWLAVESVRQGASCRLLALADRTSREPRGRPRRNRHRDAAAAVHDAMGGTCCGSRQFIESSAPDWVSLQFVPYSFQRWGVAAKLVRALPELVGRSRLHVMFHEIWIDGSTSARRRLVSAAQRRTVLALASYPRALMHTSNGDLPACAR